MANLLRPEAILIGGGISAAGELITRPLQRKLNKQLFGGTKHAPVKIMTASLQNDAGIVGASRYAMDNV
jgi:predicted NBD/HSP70 family sugar kinase